MALMWHWALLARISGTTPLPFHFPVAYLLEAVFIRPVAWACLCERANEGAGATVSLPGPASLCGTSVVYSGDGTGDSPFSFQVGGSTGA